VDLDQQTNPKENQEAKSQIITDLKLSEFIENDIVAFKTTESRDNESWFTGYICSIEVKDIPKDNGYIPEESDLIIEIINPGLLWDDDEDELVYINEIEEIILLERQDDHVKILG
jgi:hypothetical protein